MEQALSGVKSFETIKEEADSIELLKTIEQICYHYQPHEYPPLGAWEAMDKLCKCTQPDHSTETDHYETIKTIVEVCKASGVNFSLLCTHTVDMAMSTLIKGGSITVTGSGKFKDGDYFKLTDDHRELVDDKAEEIMIATRLLSLSSNKRFAAIKQELRNDLVKGKDNYPRTVPGVLKFLQFHSLHTNAEEPQNVSGKHRKQFETAFVTDGGNETDGKVEKQKSKPCGMWERGECDY